MVAYARETLVRAGWFFWALIAGVLCLLCNVPMAWRMIIQWNVYPRWAAFFIEHLAMIFWLLLGLSSLTLAWGSHPTPSKKTLGWIYSFLAIGLCLGAALSLIPRADWFKPGRLSWLLAVAAWLTPTAWEMAFERIQRPSETTRKSRTAGNGLENGVLAASVACGLTSFAVFSTLELTLAGASDPMGPGVLGQALQWSLAIHLLACLTPFVFWSLLRAGAALSSAPERLERRLIFLTLGISLFASTRSVITGYLMPDDFKILLYAAAAATGLTLAWRGQCRSRERALGEAPGEALGFAVAPWADLLSLRSANVAFSTLLAAFLAVLGFFLARHVSRYDWNRLFETSAVLATQTALFAAFLPVFLRRPTKKRVLRAPVFIALFLAALWAAAGISRALEPSWLARGHSLRLSLRHWEEREMSFRALRKVLGLSGEPNPFYAYLKQQANLDPKTSLRPLDLRPVERWGQSHKQKPDIYLFVIDSLRRDFVGAYNPLVSFTPALDALAAESLLVDKAFTAYGGTVLSIASLWAGSHLPHGSITELPPGVNALETLLGHEGYLRAGNTDAASRPPVSEDIHLCPALDELLLDAANPHRRQPLFAFTLAADAHLSVVERDSRGTGRGFRDAYAHAIAGMDACLGRFISRLKQAGRYEQSLILVTSDHGEMLGDGGLAGHAGTLRPEVVRVPLILHLPKSLAHWLLINPSAPVLLTDIVPALYALLGHKPEVLWESQGQSFLWDGRERPDARSDRSRLLSCSYSPVFGLLRENGRKLYYAHANEAQSYYYDLEADPKAKTNLTNPSVEAEHNALLRAKLSEISRIFTPAR